MFKFVVLCALVAAACADPALLAPYTYSTGVVAPAPAVYSSYPGGVVYSPSVATAPLAYSTPYGYSHFIKKRSVPLAVSSYVAPSTYVASTPLVNSWAGAYAAPYPTTYAGPYATTYSSPLYTTAHLIKKRSAPFVVPSTYVAPTPYVASSPYVAPYVASPYAAAAFSTPYVSGPLGYAQFIKK
ncbi:uncharacterized protein LOC112044945 [Bicyclus anynana]|uniref:Uncharacterized protein LOC112044945 n=1 Tax=Bicyclus anynana TaxID=110368 RepID=A0A6J1MQI4_BICAN|nr:uncharacterized protein LOC112044945 [Bicyclus anynana]